MRFIACLVAAPATVSSNLRNLRFASLVWNWAVGPQFTPQMAESAHSPDLNHVPRRGDETTY
jgi:hypothetical protein